MRTRILAIAMLAIATPAAARAPTLAERDALGRYFVGDQLGHRLCTVTLTFEPSVGGQLDAQGCAKTAPELDDAVRWWVPSDESAPVFEDPLHKVTAKFSETDAGWMANGYRDRSLSLDPVDKNFLANPGSAAVGRWSYSNEGGDDPTGGCRVVLAKGGAVTVAPKCPPSLRAANGGRWTATSSTVTLAKGGAKMALTWGATADHLFLPGGRFWIEK